MRIIIVQAEIEAAIKAYILTQIAVKEGQEITIDFKATRGEDGATAEINIGAPASPNVPATKSTQTATQSRSLPAATKTQTTASSAAAAPAVAVTEATGSETEQSADNAFTTSDQPDQPAVTSEAATAETGNQEEEGQTSTSETETFDPPAFLKPKAEDDGASDEAVQKPAPAAATAAPAKSLFANLTKPVNAKTE